MSSFASRCSQVLELDVDDRARCAPSSSGWNTTISSMRLMNSGRKCCLHARPSPRSSSARSCPRRPSPGSRCEPRFEVMTITVLRKSTVRPWPSVRRPSSSTCSSTLNTSGCAFSTSSSRITRVRLAAHRLGEVAALLVADVARRRADQARDRVLLHELATCRCGSVALRCRTGTRRAPCTARSCRRRSGPRNRNEPFGRFGSDRPARERRIASDDERAPPRPGRPRARAARLPCAAACRARPASSWRPGCRSRATRPRRSPRRRPACAAAAASRCSAVARCRPCFSCASSSGSLPYCSSRHLSASRPCAAPLPSASLILLDLFLDVRGALHLRPSRPSRFPRGRRTRVSSRSISSSISARRFFDASSFSFFTASRSILSWIRRRSSRSSASGLESISIVMRDAASSIRSIALSGRKRSVM